MLELALHILDIAENSVRAGAKTVFITLHEDTGQDRLTLTIEDDGAGMSKGVVEKVLDPFFTSKKVRHVGLGLPLLSDAAKRADGTFEIQSQEGVGTRVLVEFRLSHVDRQPLGDMAGVLVALIVGNAGTDFVYRHECENPKRVFEMDLREIRREIGDTPINHIEVLKFIRQYIMEGLDEIKPVS